MYKIFKENCSKFYVICECGEKAFTSNKLCCNNFNTFFCEKCENVILDNEYEYPKEHLNFRLKVNELLKYNLGAFPLKEGLKFAPEMKSLLDLLYLSELLIQNSYWGNDIDNKYYDMFDQATNEEEVVLCEIEKHYNPKQTEMSDAINKYVDANIRHGAGL